MVWGSKPVRDPEEYNAFLRTVRTIQGSDYGLEDLIHAVRASFDDDVRRLGLRIDNLGIADQSIWAGSSQGVVQPASRRLAHDRGRGLEPAVSAGAVGHLRRAARLPLGPASRSPTTIIVIDEAHNVCPQNPTDPHQALATEHVIRIAGEGRKYDLYLFLSTQRPSKVHQNVLSQCDNLMLMKMSSATDIRTLSETFSYAPASLVERAASFGLGEGVVAGKIAPDPLLFKTGRRFTVEGGSDVPSTWAR